MQGPEGLRILQGDLGDELAGAQIAAPLELEQEALGTDHRPGVESRNQVPARDLRGGFGHVLLLGSERTGRPALHLSWIGTTRRCRRSPDSQVERSLPAFPGRWAQWRRSGASSLITVARTVSDLHRIPGSASPVAR